METIRTSQVPGESLCAYALLLDPGGTDATGLTNVVGAASALSTAKAPATELSGLNHTALALAVYASSRRLPGPDARLASRCWPLYGAGLATRRIPTKGLALYPYIASPFPRLCLAHQISSSSKSCVDNPRKSRS